MGGEKHFLYLRRTTVEGSPPRGRGKGFLVLQWRLVAGITPAWAGKSAWRSVEIVLCWDHPRVGGEKLSSILSSSSTVGSPPRGRGKVPCVFPFLLPYGITPAWAGKSLSSSSTAFMDKDHPRVGGEKQKMPVRTDKRMGSPPRGRGKVKELSLIGVTDRITPAWAGKRLKRSHRSGIFISGPIPFHSVLHRPAGSGGSRAGRDGSPAGQPQNAGPA